jgi:predicted nucleic acid-binding protein
MRYLIDTDVMVDVSRGKVSAANYIDSLSDACIAIVTAQELIVWARDKRDVVGIDSLIAWYPVVHINHSIGDALTNSLRPMRSRTVSAPLIR